MISITSGQALPHEVITRTKPEGMGGARCANPDHHWHTVCFTPADIYGRDLGKDNIERPKVACCAKWLACSMPPCLRLPLRPLFPIATKQAPQLALRQGPHRASQNPPLAEKCISTVPECPGLCGARRSQHASARQPEAASWRLRFPGGTLKPACMACRGLESWNPPRHNGGSRNPPLRWPGPQVACQVIWLGLGGAALLVTPCAASLSATPRCH
jgi:hypothetical protein